MRSLPKNKVHRAKQQFRQGKTIREVAASVGISIGSAVSIRKADEENLPPPQVGRPRKVTETTRRKIARDLMTGKIKTLTDAQRSIQSTDGGHVHVSTIRRSLRLEGLRAYVRGAKPELDDNHKRQRLKFAMDHKDWVVDDWKRVVFSDECSISRVGSYGREFYYNKPGRQPLQPHQVRPTMKFGGGKIMIWGCITCRGPGDASWIEGTMDADTYLEVLQDYVRQSWEWYSFEPETMIFQQDNASSHTAKKVMDYLRRLEMTVLPWPPQSPDLNPIEHVWAYVKRQLSLYETAPETLEDLWERVQAIWTNIPIDFLERLYESMPRRISAVIKAKGGLTKY